MVNSLARFKGVFLVAYLLVLILRYIRVPSIIRSSQVFFRINIVCITLVMLHMQYGVKTVGYNQL
jgi:hypothetical protein